MAGHINEQLWDLFWKTAPQQQAHTAIIAELARFGIENVDPVISQSWRTFIQVCYLDQTCYLNEL